MVLVVRVVGPLVMEGGVMQETEAQLERRLEDEARTRQLGTIRDGETARGDRVRVEVSYGEQRNGEEYERAGFYLVTCAEVELADDADEFERIAAHPETVARRLVEAVLERQAELHGWTYHSIDDTYAD